MQIKKHRPKEVKNSKKQLGQFMTPKLIASFMAKLLFEGMQKKKIRILEPSAGKGALVSAVFEQVTSMQKKPEKVEFVLYEVDDLLLPQLNLLVNELRKKAKAIGVVVSFSIRNKDFLLNSPEGKFDIVIANPPFFKLRKNDDRAIAHKYVIYGQPNIYGLFMASCAQLLKDDGRYCFLTPRSWTSGSYFTELRKYLFKHLQLEAVHLFQNRESTFRKDRIQQEMMITWAKAQSHIQKDVMLSASDGVAGLDSYNGTLVSFSNVFTGKPCKLVNLPLATAQYEIDKLSDTLESIGLRVSTGKVVPFRATNWLANRHAKNTVPLLWMRNIRRNEICWPLKTDREYFINTKESNKLLIPKGNYVLIRRFSPRDQENWVTAAPLLMTNDSYASIGVENHLNYIYSITSQLNADEATGLAAYLNSKQVSLYFSSRIGHTQINAADLNSLPLLNRVQLSEIGRQVKNNPKLNINDLTHSAIIEKQKIDNPAVMKD